MAFYKVLETSFIGLKLCQEGEVVDINDNPKDGGMAPGANLVACDEEGNPKATRAARGRAPAAKDEDASDLA